jgi:hypothetical protein
VRLGRRWLTYAGWGSAIGFVAALILPRGAPLVVDGAWPMRLEYWMLLVLAAPLVLVLRSPRLAATASGTLSGLTAVLWLAYPDGPVGCGNNALPACIGRTPNDWLVVIGILVGLSAVLFAIAWRRWPAHGRPQLPTHGEWAERRPPVFVALGGLAVLVGSFVVWDTCPKIPCEGSFGLFALMPRSGLDIGPGVVTAEVGVLLVLTGVAAFREGGTSPFRTEAIGLGGLAVLLVAAYLIRTYLVPDFLTDGPDLGPYLVVGGAATAAIASARLRPPDLRTSAWWQARRAATALVVSGITIWSLSMTGYVAVGIEPLTYAVILVALGIGVWPSRLPMTRVKPVTIGVLVVLYGAVSLAAIVLGDFTIVLLEAMPLVVIVGVAVLGVLDLPVATTQPGSSVEWIDAALVAVRSIGGLLLAALLLTGAMLALLLIRLLAAEDLLFRLSWLGGEPADAQWLVVMVAAGLALAGGIGVAFARRAVWREDGWTERGSEADSDGP